MRTETNKPVLAYVALGANLGDRSKNIRDAIESLGRQEDIKVLRVSSPLENPAIGGPAGSPSFLNAVAEVETSLGPRELLERLFKVERELGRQRRERWGPRTIDLDLILYSDRIIQEPELTVPHPLMHLRRFVLEPMAELAPDQRHPVLGKTVDELLRELLGSKTEQA
jgi:2-amino-4-hydroxy-6-hydroxymethyldihydropteridine diphosphokinase